jgi:hypothetical protein
MLAADIGGPWKQLRAETYVPKNATDIDTYSFFPLQVLDADSTFYLSEPCLLTGRLGPRGVVPGVYDDTVSKLMLTEIVEPTNPAANKAFLFIKDNGAGKTQLCVRFGSGATQVVAIEP